MTRFLLIFAAVYGGMHAFLFWQALRAFPLSAVSGALVALFFLGMVAAPVLTRWLDHRGLAALARPLAFVGYSWIAVAFWLFLLFAARDLWNLAAAGIARIAPGAACTFIPLRASAVAFIALVALAWLWGLHEANDIRLEEVTVRTPHLPAGSPSIRIAFVSDVHVDLLVGERKILEIARILDQARPDLVLSGGDLVDASAEREDGVARILAGIRPPLGKFAVTGNHEYYAGIERSEAFTRAAGFRLLHGESVTVGGRLVLVGVDDPTAAWSGLPGRANEDQLLPARPDRPAVVLLKHRPEVAAGSPGRFDLQLSGHTHRGQIYPFRYFVAIRYPLPDGLSAVGSGSWLYKGRGTGTWGPPLRVLAPPEVTLVTLESLSP